MTYALTFCLDNAKLKKLYPHPDQWRDAYQDIAQVLAGYGFVSYQSALYFGLPDVTAVQCVLATQKLAQIYPWFLPTVTDIRMIQINEMTDLVTSITPITSKTEK